MELCICIHLLQLLLFSLPSRMQADATMTEYSSQCLRQYSFCHFFIERCFSSFATNLQLGMSRNEPLR